MGFCSSDMRVIPGHGRLGNCAELEDFGQMLADATERIRKLMEEGKSLAEIIEARPNADFDEKLGHGWIKPARFAEFVYYSLQDDGS